MSVPLASGIFFVVGEKKNVKFQRLNQDLPLVPNFNSKTWYQIHGKNAFHSSIH